MNFTKIKFIGRFLLIGFICFLITRCSQKKAPSEGEVLAKTLCVSCHVFPDPSLLSKDVWMSKTLPEMGLRLGMSHHGPQYYDNKTGLDIYPKNPLLNQLDWEKLVMYYKTTAPEEIPIYKQAALSSTAIFDCQSFKYDSVPSTIITMTEYNKTDHSLYLGDGGNSSLVRVNVDGKVLESKKLNSPPVKIDFKNSSSQVLTIGSLYPSNEKEGLLSLSETEIDSLIRPVDFLMKDVNQDGFEDVVVCEFGNTIGNLVWYENLNKGSYKRHIIHPLSGSIKIKYADIDNDGQEELLALFAQETESLYAFVYENNAFSIKKIVQFHPAFGVNDFQLEDMNNDGLLDVIISNGDNADYSEVLKNYHGIRIYLNEDNYTFSESYFYPYHGTSKVEVVDFNLDGKQDVLAISNFGDLTDPNFENIVLLINTGDLEFSPTRIADVPGCGWQTIDVKDFDNDGDKDVFVGAFNIKLGPPESIPKKQENISWILLKNRTNIK